MHDAARKQSHQMIRIVTHAAQGAFLLTSKQMIGCILGGVAPSSPPYFMCLATQTFCISRPLQY